MNNYEGETVINPTTSTLKSQIAKVSDRLANWVRTIPAPPKNSGKAHKLEMVSFRPLKYRLTLVPDLKYFKA